VAAAECQGGRNDENHHPVPGYVFTSFFILKGNAFLAYIHACYVCRPCEARYVVARMLRAPLTARR
jgi:hypothetical protein